MRKMLLVAAFNAEKINTQAFLSAFLSAAFFWAVLKSELYSHFWEYNTFQKWTNLYNNAKFLLLGLLNSSKTFSAFNMTYILYTSNGD